MAKPWRLLGNPYGIFSQPPQPWPPKCILLAKSTPRWLEQVLAAMPRCPS